MTTALRPSSVRKAARARQGKIVGVCKNPDKLLQVIVGHLTVKWEHHEHMEAGMQQAKVIGTRNVTRIPARVAEFGSRLIRPPHQNKCVCCPLWRRMIALWWTTPKSKVPPAIKK